MGADPFDGGEGGGMSIKDRLRGAQGIEQAAGKNGADARKASETQPCEEMVGHG
jgi:hypothetical protein